MAVADQMSSQLRLVFYDGEDVLTGDPIYKSKNFNRVKTTANADALYTVAHAIAGLQERPLHAIERRDVAEIRES